MTSTATAFGQRVQQWVEETHEKIRAALEQLDGGRRFAVDSWNRPGGGGGVTSVMTDGRLFERAGINRSAVWGELSDAALARLGRPERQFYATGVSLVLHPHSPMVPTVHANFRYFERGHDAWFGGGSDLTPYYPYEEDARHFHRVWKNVCDRHGPLLYDRYKRWCDVYFFLPHPGEMRGVGGIFFDDLRENREATFSFVRDCADALLPSYVPIVERRRDEPYGEKERQFQLYRRGRYAEFNLAYDRGTAFGLATQGRTESILMSLPPLARWEYCWTPEPGSREEAAMGFLQPHNWAD
jgi:coproporphyrinogen III oxidase